MDFFNKNFKKIKPEKTLELELDPNWHTDPDAAIKHLSLQKAYIRICDIMMNTSGNDRRSRLQEEAIDNIDSAIILIVSPECHKVLGDLAVSDISPQGTKQKWLQVGYYDDIVDFNDILNNEKTISFICKLATIHPILFPWMMSDGKILDALLNHVATASYIEMIGRKDQSNAEWMIHHKIFTEKFWLSKDADAFWVLSQWANTHPPEFFTTMMKNTDIKQKRWLDSQLNSEEKRQIANHLFSLAIAKGITSQGQPKKTSKAMLKVILDDKDIRSFLIKNYSHGSINSNGFYDFITQLFAIDNSNLALMIEYDEIKQYLIEIAIKQSWIKLSSEEIVNSASSNGFNFFKELINRPPEAVLKPLSRTELSKACGKEPTLWESIYDRYIGGM